MCKFVLQNVFQPLYRIKHTLIWQDLLWRKRLFGLNFVVELTFNYENTVLAILLDPVLTPELLQPIDKVTVRVNNLSFGM